MPTNLFEGAGGILHLMEAATALTQLVDVPLNSYSSVDSWELSTSHIPSITSETEKKPMPDGPGSAHPISDDDTMLVCPKIATLRKNHLKALYSATLSVVSTCGLDNVREVSTKTGSTSLIFSKVQETSNQDKAKNTKLKESFPSRLHALLADPTVQEVITWLPHGRSFVVLRPDDLATTVLPKYFVLEGSNSYPPMSGSVKQQDYHTHKYPSFTRKLNRWGFRQLSRGTDAGAFYHEMFRRDDPKLCLKIVCQKSRKDKQCVGFKRPVNENISISSASTMAHDSCDNCPLSSAITVSTRSVSKKSLPFKKRKSIPSMSHYMMDIPSDVGLTTSIYHSSNYQSCNKSDFETVSNLSDNGSVCSSSIRTVTSPLLHNPTPFATNISVSTAKEVLLNNFYQQQRAVALASLMENSRLAVEASGMKQNTNIVPHQSLMLLCYPPNETPSPILREPHNDLLQSKVSPCENGSILHRPSSISMDEIKNSLYMAYIQALTSSK